MNPSHLKHVLKKDQYTKKYQTLTKMLCSLVKDFNLVGFIGLNVQDKESMNYLRKIIDKSNGYVYGALTPNNSSIFEVSERDQSWEWTSG